MTLAVVIFVYIPGIVLRCVSVKELDNAKIEKQNRRRKVFSLASKSGLN